jgi:hypothetical protein
MLALLLLVAVGATACWQALTLARGDLAGRAAQIEVSRWSAQEETATPAAWQQARAALDAAQRITPGDPRPQTYLGDLYVVAALSEGATPEQQATAFRQAQAFYQRALALRPADALSWASLGLTQFGLGQTGAAYTAAWANALKLGPHDGSTQLVLAQLALMSWDAAPPNAQRWLLATYADANTAQQASLQQAAEGYGLTFSASNAGPPTLLRAPVPASNAASAP